MLDQEKDLHIITKAIMRAYQDEMHEYLSSKPQGTLTEADVILMIMNLSISISTNIYYSLKQIVPNAPMDFDFMKVKITNTIADALENIKQFTPSSTIVSLSVEQVKELQDTGFIMLKNENGTERKITLEDVMVRKEDSQKIIQDAKKDAVHVSNTKKIITKSNGLLPGQRGQS